MPTPGFTPEEELQVWKDIAARRDDEIIALEAKLKAATPTPPPPTPTPAPPAAPPPPLPALNEYIRMSSSEKARVRAAYGEDFEERAHADFMQANRIRNARMGVAADDRRLSMQIEEDRLAPPAKFDGEQWAGRPVARTFPDSRPLTAAEANAAAIAAAMNAQRGQGVPPASAPPRKDARGRFLPR